MQKNELIVIKRILEILANVQKVVDETFDFGLHLPDTKAEGILRDKVTYIKRSDTLEYIKDSTYITINYTGYLKGCSTYYSYTVYKYGIEYSGNSKHVFITYYNPEKKQEKKYSMLRYDGKDLYNFLDEFKSFNIDESVEHLNKKCEFQVGSSRIHASTFIPYINKKDKIYRKAWSKQQAEKNKKRLYPIKRDKNIVKKNKVRNF